MKYSVHVEEDSSGLIGASKKVGIGLGPGTDPDKAVFLLFAAAVRLLVGGVTTPPPADPKDTNLN